MATVESAMGETVLVLMVFGVCVHGPPCAAGSGWRLGLLSEKRLPTITHGQPRWVRGVPSGCGKKSGIENGERDDNYMSKHTDGSWPEKRRVQVHTNLLC
jgi:hypothetical protein